MSDIESQLRASDPLLSLKSSPIDFDAMKSRVTVHASGVARVSRRRQMKVLSFATVAILVTTVTWVSVSGDTAVFHGPQLGGRSALKAGGTSVIYGTNATAASSASLDFGTSTNGSDFEPGSATRVYGAGAGLSAPVTSGSVYKLNGFDDAASEAQHLATLFGVSATMTAVPSPVFAAEYQAGDMSSSTGSMQYFVGGKDGIDAGFGTFQYIADNEENWAFDGPITSTVDPATAARDLNTVTTLWKALGTGLTLSHPTWMVMQLSPDSHATSTTETQVNFFLSIDGFQTLQVEQFSFDDTGKLVYAVGPNLSIVDSVVFPFQGMAATIDLLNAQEYGDCSPTAVPLATEWGSTTSTAPAITETLDGASILYQPEMMSNGEPWLVPFYMFTDSDGAQSSAPWISALGPAYFSVHKGAGSSCSMTLTQP